MNRFDRRLQGLAIGLSALAGFVDATGFLALGGFFVAFMSGNSTRLAVALASGRWALAGVAGGLIATFVAGVVGGSLTGHFARTHRRPAVLALVAVLLALAPAFAAIGSSRAAIVAMVLAMGAENAVFERDGDTVGLTYMTGALVKVGQRLTLALFGGERFGWVGYFGLWSGLVGGATAGALAFPLFGLAGLWFAAATAGMLAVLAARL